jgi:chromosome segregation ATPase
MDSSRHWKTASAAMLLNEIDVLLAQMRLLETEVNRAQAAADENMAQLREQFAAELSAKDQALEACKDDQQRRASAAEGAFERRMAELESANRSISARAEQLEAVRRAHEAEITALRHQTDVQERALSERQQAVTVTELALHDKVQSLNQELARRRRELDERDIALRGMKQELEARLRSQEDELAAAQARIRQGDAMFKSTVDELQIELREKQLIAETRAAEIARLKATLDQLSTRIAQQDESPQRSTAATAEEIAAIRAAHRAEVGALEERYQAAVRALEDRLANERQMVVELRKQLASLQEQSRDGGAQLHRPASVPSKEHEVEAQIVQSLRNEIQRLIHESQEKNRIIEDRNDEVVRVKSELDQLHDRVNQLQSMRRHAEQTVGGEAERMRTEFQAQLALLQAELSQKQWALEELQGASHGLEQRLRQELDSVRRDLATRMSPSLTDKGDCVSGEIQTDCLDMEGFRVTEDGAGAAHKSRSSYHRRWHTGLGWKRRWRT